MIASSGFLAALECTKFIFRPDPTGGAYIAPPDTLAALRGPASRGRGEEGNGRDRPLRKFLDPPLIIPGRDVCIL